MAMIRFGSQDSLRRAGDAAREAQGSLIATRALPGSTTESTTPDSHRHAPLTVGVL